MNDATPRCFPRAFVAAAPLLAAILAPVACGSRTPLDALLLTSDSGVTDTGAVDSPPEASCGSTGVPCASNSECCGALQCIDGQCGTGPSCLPNGTPCTSDTNCCNACVGGTCATGPACAGTGASCVATNDCCSGLTCNDFTCGVAPPPCRPAGSSCTGASQCCSNECGGGVCGTSTCASVGQTACDMCVVQSCCPQVAACEMESECSSYLQCVTTCETGGSSGVACNQQCAQLLDQAGNALDSCAVQMCNGPCSAG